ncbi:DUF2705 family protein [Listeria grandensis]|uniref:DUF2705 family protein n=1 Tax=Listeria grandensis TaxID=1494963 RepID=A0A7X0Y4G7_9LIST|nr:DUF2705 family protein [Listeria grandensis]MBC1936424.1 DUF2705 family protein [Listeria grandensis]
MKNNMRWCLVFMGLFIIQVLFSSSKLMHGNVYPFLAGVPMTVSAVTTSIYLMVWYLPIVALGFYFTGFVKDSLSQYGVLLLVRQYSKWRWLLKRFLYLIIVTGIFVSLQVAVHICFFQKGMPFSEAILVAVFFYFVTLIVLFSIQVTLEIVTDVQIAFLVVNIMAICSVLAMPSLMVMHAPKLVVYFLFTNLGMDYRRGEISTMIETMLVLLAIEIVCISIAMYKIKKIDILR